MEFKDALTQAMTEHDVAVERVAADLGISYATVRRWMIGQGEPGATQYRELHTLLPTLKRRFETSSSSEPTHAS